MSDNRSEIQKKTFTRWINTHLSDKDLKIECLTKDLEDGTNLIQLLQIISGKRIKKYKKNPKKKLQKIENLNIALKFIKGEGLTLVNIGAEDIQGGNLKIILGLIWTLILRYQINKENYNEDGSARPRAASTSSYGGDGSAPKKKKKKKDDSAKKDLLKWVNQQLKPYNQSVKGFKKEWKDPNKLCCLADSLQPGCIDVSSVAKDADADDNQRTKDINNAMETAEKLFKIPPVMEAGDMATQPDELSVMTYVSYYRDKAHEMERKARETENCKAEGPGLEPGEIKEGEPREFTVYCIDHEGKALLPDDAAVSMCNVIIQDPSGNDLKCDVVEDPQPGKFNCAYVANNPGTYTITVQVKGVVIKNFPMKVDINASSNAKVCNFSFTVHAANCRGELEKVGGDLFDAEVKDERGNIAGRVDCKDNGDGTYSASYQLFSGQLYRVYANLNGEPLANSPFIHDLRTGVDKSKYVY